MKMNKQLLETKKTLLEALNCFEDLETYFFMQGKVETARFIRTLEKDYIDKIESLISIMEGNYAVR